MTAENIFDLVLALCFWEESDKTEYEAQFLSILRLRLAECFDANNALRAKAGKQPLDEPPVITSLSDTVGYESYLTMVALPLGIAGFMFTEDDDSGVSNVYRADYYEKLSGIGTASFREAEEA